MICLLVSSADNILPSLDPDQAVQNVGPDLTLMVFPKEFFEEVDFEKSADDKKACKITQHATSQANEALKLGPEQQMAIALFNNTNLSPVRLILDDHREQNSSKSFGPRRKKTCLRRFANNKGTDQPAHLRSLISAFVIRLLESTISRLATSEMSIF